jgi:hypothetical protein
VNRAQLSEASIMEAAGGFAGLSMVKPKSITVKRVVNGQPVQYRFTFEEMSRPEWKEFLINEGDVIIVNRILF